MKLIRFGEPGKEKPGVIVDGKWLDVSSYAKDYNGDFFEYDGTIDLTNIVAEHNDDLPQISKDTRLGPPVSGPSKIVCVGLNYAKHAKETNAAIPTEPVLFLKSTTATLYFEIEKEDELRKTGFSKEGKHQQPQIVLGLLVSIDGYPLAYEMFEGNKFEGHTMLPVIEAFKAKYGLKQLVVIADAGLMSNDNITELQNKNYQYIIGARIKNETWAIQKNILATSLNNGETVAINKDENSRIIISYSDGRATKDAANRKRGVVTISIDKEKYKADAKWDGLKGYITNTRLTKDQIIENHNHLWQIEKAFRILKTDLRIRPIYHRLRHRIEAHIVLLFVHIKSVRN